MHVRKYTSHHLINNNDLFSTPGAQHVSFIACFHHAELCLSNQISIFINSLASMDIPAVCSFVNDTSTCHEVSRPMLIQTLVTHAFGGKAIKPKNI
ncbi:hypothetical protein K431DRAFT_7610 [Polychaeton citri CBS 116435]|uniref:Uncharacterized protein n=1 Tax=Polychaeton citri CBS 116435 TaxID=1314669 RepID=A0A9P4QCP1_9PEZI|nr:hypothetical protein K431DRAFT_7610 [Polychaeton citri CBS 116435]